MKNIKRILRKIAANRAMFFDFCAWMPAVVIFIAELIYYFCFSPRDIKFRPFVKMAVIIAGGGFLVGMLCYDRICEWLDKE